ncbi:unnamed protein product [Rotaria magnacalcarata]|uniref:Uncharacterized protein n=1 Tax=Rotaria magnacalcarata TaxID=392030 RepID=A0A8S2IXN8_9BILA|nr:unnamed protein product [Rotaria magnacalcarata]CAF3919071.1 unnamed protein product [Rotaria magnacalcarata]CAF4031383.1 unnamed protein product [Rotaria magnacalcarata]
MEVLTYFWKRTFTYRRLCIRNNVIKEVLLEYSAYSWASLMSFLEQVRMITDTDIERNVELFLTMLLEKLPNNSMFLSGSFDTEATTISPQNPKQRPKRMTKVPFDSIRLKTRKKSV